MDRKRKFQKRHNANDFVMTSLSTNTTVRVDFDQQRELFATDSIYEVGAMIPKFNFDG